MRLLSRIFTFAIRVGVNAFALWCASYVLPDFRIETADSGMEPYLAYLMLGAVLAVVNAVVRPVVALLTTPLYILTLGLFSISVSAFMLLIAAGISQEFLPVELLIPGLSTAIIAALIIGVVNWVFGLVLRFVR